MFFEQSNYRDDAFLFASVNTQNRSDRPTKRQIGPRTQRPNSQYQYALKCIFSATDLDPHGACAGSRSVFRFRHCRMSNTALEE
jgi:hypothetical protein